MPRDISEAVKQAARLDLAAAKYSAEEIALAMSGLLGREVTAEQLDGFVQAGAMSMPVHLVPAWVRVTGSRRILDVLQERI